MVLTWGDGGREATCRRAAALPSNGQVEVWESDGSHSSIPGLEPERESAVSGGTGTLSLSPRPMRRAAGHMLPGWWIPSVPTLSLPQSATIHLLRATVLAPRASYTLSPDPFSIASSPPSVPDLSQIASLLCSFSCIAPSFSRHL